MGCSWGLWEGRKCDFFVATSLAAASDDCWGLKREKMRLSLCCKARLAWWVFGPRRRDFRGSAKRPRPKTLKIRGQAHGPKRPRRLRRRRGCWRRRFVHAASGRESLKWAVKETVRRRPQPLGSRPTAPRSGKRRPATCFYAARGRLVRRFAPPPAITIPQGFRGRRPSKRRVSARMLAAQRRAARACRADACMPG